MVQILFGVRAEHRGVVRGTPHRPNRGLPPWKLKDMIFYTRKSKEKRGVSTLGQTDAFLFRIIVISIEKHVFGVRKLVFTYKNNNVTKEN